MFPKYVQVNTRDLRLAVREGMRPMTEFFDPRYDRLPFFGNEMTGPAWGNSHHASFSMAHIPGRWLNALLNAGDVLHEGVLKQAVDDLSAWAFRAMDLPDIPFPGCLDMQSMQPRKQMDLHNLREQMHAMYALYRFRGNERARTMALEMIKAVNLYYDFELARFDEQLFTRETGCSVMRWPTENNRLPFPVTFGRYIGPLVKFFRVSGEAEALRQAIRLKNVCFAHVMDEQGTYDPERFGNHTHSTTAMLSSLAQLYEVTADSEILHRILAFVDNGLPRIAIDIGWCIEGYRRTDSVGEINNTTDIMETMLILGRHGVPGAYARAERILRAHLLPAQLLDTSFIPEDDDPSHVSTYLMPERAKGAFGFPCPYGHEDKPGAPISFNWDIVGGGVGGLCEALRAQIVENDTLVSINLLFDSSSPACIFKSPYGRNDTAFLTLQKPGLSARIRIPTGAAGWCVSGADAYEDGEWLYLTGLPAGVKAEVRYDFPQRDVSYPFRQYEYRFRWRGEEVTACESDGKRLCFFSSLDNAVQSGV